MAALSRASVEEDLRQKRISVVRVYGWPLRRTMTIVHHVHKYTSRPLQGFLDAVRSHAQSSIERYQGDR
ncbi:MAG: hypothetical protein HY912_08525 [Desulfomonile tiedjei]|uniref:LysR substrate-binding domain-containing protein n=1 Tax=Desulfomonile tiedjei TaxID=2358 RepID=A0A9D6Z368_9BACT|nr:hypothetical protein [Desulfomonile tiedjei]